MALTGVQKQRRKLQIFSWAGAGLVAGILVVLNFVASYLPLRMDTSQGNSYSLSPGSKDLLKKLDDTLLVRIMFSAALPPNYKLNEKYLSDLMAEYKRASHGKVRVEYFDPSLSPNAREEAISQGVVPVQLDVRERDRREVKECFMGVAFLYGDKKGAIPLIQDSQNLEYEVTVQIKRMIDPEKPVLGVGQVGGSLLFTDEPLQALSQAVAQLYNARPLDLNQPIPAEVKAVWIIGPKKPAEPAALTNLQNYLNNGGSVGLLLDKRDVVVNEFRTSVLATGFEPFLEYAGLEILDGLIVDPRCDRIQIRATQGAFQMLNVVDYPYIPVVVDINKTHPASKGIEAFTMAYASPIEIKQNKPGVTYTVLARSSDQSHLETNPFSVNPLNERFRAPDAPSGPFTMAAIAEGTFDPAAGPSVKPGRLVLFSSSRFIRTEFPVKQSNFSLFLNLMDWSVLDDVLLQIRSKGLVQKPLKRLDDGIRILLKTLMIVSLPLLSLLAGVVVWQRQKIRRAMLRLIYREATQ